MSYARFTDGDVYVFANTDGQLECCGCMLQEREWVDDPSMPFTHGYYRAVGEIVPYRFDGTTGMIAHLQRHTNAGHDVPDYVVPALLEDDAENFPDGDTR